MSELTHFDSEGRSQMVDVGDKVPTKRKAVAVATVEMQPTTFELIQKREIGKGDVVEVARLAGIMGSKRTADLIPLCHPISVTSVNLAFEFHEPGKIEITSTVEAMDRTGVEMEALTSVTTAALTIYDMCKSVDRAMQVREIKLLHKSGGKSGTFDRSPDVSSGE